MSRRQHLSMLLDHSPAVLPSLLLCDFGNLKGEVTRLESAGAQALHLDVMDGNFVPNLTYGMPIVAAIRKLTELPLDVHLMIQDPSRYVEQFYQAGADIITVHVESTNEPRAVLEQIHELGAGAGIALNPSTPLSSIENCLDICDLVLVMSVDAGFGGQQFSSVALEKLRQLRQQVRSDVILQVDGGVNRDTISKCAAAGAQLFVVGSAIFNEPDYVQAIKDLRALANV